MSGLISRGAVDDYLSRRFDDWEWVKSLSREDVYNELREYGPLPDFKTDPYVHQLQAFFVCVNVPRFSLFLDMGLGKTKIILDILSYRRQLNRKLVALVVTHNDDSVGEWLEQTAIHSDLIAVPVIGGPEEKRDALAKDADLYVVSYPAISSYLAPLVKKNKRGKKRIRRLSDRLVHSLTSKIDVVVFDELHVARNPGSLTGQTCRAISEGCAGAYGLTGRPMGRDPRALFGDMLCVDLGDTFGDSLELYETAYFTTRMRRARIIFDFDKSLTDNLHARLKHRSITYMEDECFDMPDIVRKVYRLPATEEIKTCLHAIRERSDGEMPDPSTFHDIRRVTAGHFVTEDEDGPITVPLRDPVKIRNLIEILQIVPHDKRCIVFYEYNLTGAAAEKALAEAGITSIRLWSGSARDTVPIFKTDPGIKVLLANWKSGGTGLNLQVANYVIFLESPSCPIQRDQAEKRVRPRLQKRSFIFDIVVRGTTDEKILTYLAEGKNLFDSIVLGEDSALPSILRKRMPA